MAATIQNIELPKKPRALDSSGNNNHGKIYSGRALEFDGVTDYLDIPSSSTSHTWWREDVGKYNTTACWIHINTHANAAVWVTDNDSQGSRLGLIIKNDGTISFTTWNGSGYTHVSPTNAEKLNLNTWYRIVCIVDNGVKKLYINGIQQTGSTEAVSSGLAGTVAGAARISAPNNSVTHFNGMVSDWQAWDSVWSADDAAYDFANPESLALNASGTALTEGNLKVWYPMQDGHRGQQSYILDGANTGIVSALIDHDFSTDTTSEWATADTSSPDDRGAISYVADGFLRVTYTGLSGAVLNKASILTEGVSYKITFRAKGTHDAIFASVGNNGDIGYAVSNPTLTTDWQDYEFYITADDSATLRLYQAGTPDADQTLDIDNILVQPINDKHHATTVFFGDELITDTNDRTFAGASNWSNGNGSNTNNDFTVYNENYTGAGYSGGALQLLSSDDASNVQFAILDGAAGNGWETDMVEGRTYRLSFQAAMARTSGTLSVGFANASHALSSDIREFTTTAGTDAVYTFDFVYNATNHAELIAHAAVSSQWIAILDDISIKEVGTATGWTDADQQLHIAQPALQSYNELAWFGGANDYVPISADVANFGTDDFTISTWVYINNEGIIDSEKYIVARREDANKFWKIAYNYNTDRFIITIKDGAGGTDIIGHSADTALTASMQSKWHHIVCSVDRGGYLNFYVNGSTTYGKSFDISSRSAVDIDNTGVFTIGATSGGGNYFNGCITEVSIFDGIALSSAQVNELYNDGKALDATTHSQASSYLTGYWRNNGLNTWSNLDNPGTVDGTPTNFTETLLIPQGVDGSRDAQGFIMNKARDTSCLNLTNNTIQDYVDLGVTSTIAAAGTASFVMWIKPDDLADNNFLSAGGSDYFRIQSSTILDFVANGETGLDFTVDTMTAGEWMHVALVKAGNGTDEMSVYVNGAASTDTETSSASFDFRYIGSLGPNSGGFRGQIDGFLYYDDVLSGPEVLQNYNATKGVHTN